MNQLLLASSVRTHSGLVALQQRSSAHLRNAWAERNDETGVDEAVTKMIWLAVGIGVAVAATGFFTTVYTAARGNVPTPVAPLP